ncbi:NAD-P-binding protein [Trametes polyzona]|nr:NAD-P-binding protein [Trametes polyzona]
MSAAPLTTWLVTGASRGIGLELVRQLLASANNVVVAACRNPDSATLLNELSTTAKGAFHTIKLDIDDFDAVRSIGKVLDGIIGETGLDYLINNAGIAEGGLAFALDPDVVMRTFRTNVVGPALVSQACLPFLERGRRKTILNISSTAGSIATAPLVPVTRNTSYAMSKTALNMLTYKQKLERPDITAIAMCPGWTKTDMGGQNAMLEPKESVAGVLKVITSVTLADSGKYLRYNGEEIPW